MKKMGARKRPTRSDVAKVAGVSPALVSFVLNGYPNVKPETRERVLAVIRELGYEPNLVARSLKSNRTHLLAFLADDITNPFFPELATGMEAAARGAGYGLILCQADREDPAPAIQLITSRRPDGVIIGALPLDLIRYMQQKGLEVVSSYWQPEEASISWVDTDWAGGVRLAMDHLHALGHRHFAMIRGGREEFRSRAYREHCEALGATGAERVAAGDWSLEGGHSAMLALLDGGRAFTAVVAANDLMALGALQACRERSIRIPEELSLVGYDDITMATVAWPPLTTVHFPRFQAGRIAVALLLEAIAGQAPRGELLPPRLVVRGSTGPAAAL
jgi:DNA-binding LacI/PurR family transcriptional regulator